MEDDLTILATQPSTVAVHTVRHDDTTFTYGATADKYELADQARVKEGEFLLRGRRRFHF